MNLVAFAYFIGSLGIAYGIVLFATGGWPLLLLPPFIRVSRSHAAARWWGGASLFFPGGFLVAAILYGRWDLTAPVDHLFARSDIMWVVLVLASAACVEMSVLSVRHQRRNDRSQPVSSDGDEPELKIDRGAS